MNKELAALERLIPSKSHFNLLIPIGLVSLIFSISYSAYTLSTPNTACRQKLLWFLAASLQLVTIFTQAAGAALQGHTSSSSNLKTQDLNPDFWFIINSEHCSLDEMYTYLSSTSYIWENIPSKGSKNFCYFNEIGTTWPYNIIKVQNLVCLSQAIHLSKLSFSPAKYTCIYMSL